VKLEVKDKSYIKKRVYSHHLSSKTFHDNGQNFFLKLLLRFSSIKNMPALLLLLPIDQLKISISDFDIEIIVEDNSKFLSLNTHLKSSEKFSVRVNIPVVPSFFEKGRNTSPYYVPYEKNLRYFREIGMN
jgi:hypothetical protein